jgi:hypothetical protein
MGYDLHAGLHDYTRDPAVSGTEIDAVAVATRVRHRRAVRATTTGLVSTAAAAVLAASAYGLTTMPTTDLAPAEPSSSSPAGVDTTPTPVATPSPTPTVTPAPTPTPTPSPSTPVVPPADEDVADVPVFRTGARVGDFPSNAPEADVVAYLTEVLGVQPARSDPDYACPPGMVPGRILEWPGTGVGLRVRTTDDAGGMVDPYVAAWTLMEPSATLGLATDAGLSAGDARDRILQLYPEAPHGEQDFSGAVQWWYTPADESGSLLVIGVDDGPVSRIESGYGCGE